MEISTTSLPEEDYPPNNPIIMWRPKQNSYHVGVSRVGDYAYITMSSTILMNELKRTSANTFWIYRNPLMNPKDLVSCLTSIRNSNITLVFPRGNFVLYDYLPRSNIVLAQVTNLYIHGSQNLYGTHYGISNCLHTMIMHCRYATNIQLYEVAITSEVIEALNECTNLERLTIFHANIVDVQMNNLGYTILNHFAANSLKHISLGANETTQAHHMYNFCQSFIGKYELYTRVDRDRVLESFSLKFGNLRHLKIEQLTRLKVNQLRMYVDAYENETQCNTNIQCLKEIINIGFEAKRLHIQIFSLNESGKRHYGIQNNHVQEYNDNVSHLIQTIKGRNDVNEKANNSNRVYSKRVRTLPDEKEREIGTNIWKIRHEHDIMDKMYSIHFPHYPYNRNPQYFHHPN